jgi:lipoprotein LprG
MHPLHNSYRGILLLGITACLLLAGCGAGSAGGPATTPTPTPGPEEIVDQVMQALQETDSLAFRIDFEGATVYADPNELFALLSVEGGLQRPDGARAIIQVRSVGSVAEIRLVSLAGQLYATNPITRQWTCIPEGALFDPVVLFDQQQGIEQLIREQFEDVSLQGIEEIEGQPHYHLRGTMPGPPLAQLSYGLLGAGPVLVDIWADVETRHVRQIQLVDSESDPDEPSTWQLRLSAYGEPVEILAPVACE